MIHNISLAWLSGALRVPPDSPDHMMPQLYVTIRLQRTQARARQFLNMFLQLDPLDRQIFKGFILDSDVAFGKRDPREARLPFKGFVLALSGFPFGPLGIFENLETQRRASVILFIKNIIIIDYHVLSELR